MGLIHIEMFATLDLVGQAPGGPDEDRWGEVRGLPRQARSLVGRVHAARPGPPGRGARDP